MADIAVDLPADNAKTKDQDISILDPGLVHPAMMLLEKKEKADGEETVIEPIMVRNASGKKCLYYFEEGSHHLLEVVEGKTDAYLPDRAEEIEVLYKKMWREVFSVVRIFTSFFVLFFVEAVFYLIHYVSQPLVLNSVSVVGNQLLKPTLIAVFNNLIKPVFTSVWNILNAVDTALNPLINLLSKFGEQVANILRSIQLFSVNYLSDTPKRKVETV